MRLERAFGGILSLAAAALAGCAYEPVNPYPPVADAGVWGAAPGGYVVDKAPLAQPDPLFIDEGPPPLMAELIPPRPYGQVVWVPGYWGWQSRWVWAPGRWLSPPRPGYVWTNPYYERRGGIVVFVSGFWCPPHAMFAPPPPYLRRPVRSANGLPPVGLPARPMPPPVAPGAQRGDSRARHGLIGRPVPHRDNPQPVMVPRGKPRQQDAHGSQNEGASRAGRSFMGRATERRGDR
jgi:hypothetical protein